MRGHVRNVAEKKKRPLLRIGLLLLAGVALYAIGHFTGLTEQVTPENIRQTVQDAGPWGVLVFIAAFAVGLFLHVPGMVFVATGVLLWGRIAGFFVGLIGALIAVSFTFVIVRRAGGQALTEIERPFVKKVMAKIETRPILTVVILRSVLWLAPGLNYALAMSNVRFSHFVIGSAIGLVVPVGIVTAAAEMFLG